MKNANENFLEFKGFELSLTISAFSVGENVSDFIA